MEPPLQVVLLSRPLELEQDRTLVDRIRRALIARRVELWCTELDLLPGDDIEAEMSRRLRAAKVLLILITAQDAVRDAQDDWWYRSGIAVAVERKKTHSARVIPLIAPGVEPTLSLLRLQPAEIALEDPGRTVTNLFERLPETQPYMLQLPGDRQPPRPRQRVTGPGILLADPVLRTDETSPSEPSGAMLERETAIRPSLVWIRGGETRVGSPPTEPLRARDEPEVRSVVIPSGYLLATTPLTRAQFRALTRLDGSPVLPDILRRTAGDGLPDEAPLTNLSWNEAAVVCNALSWAEGLDAAYHKRGDTWVRRSAVVTGYRLPTETEWEHACRAHSATPFWSGAGDPRAWYRDTCRILKAVGQHPANSWGLHDMHGLVWEWCDSDSAPGCATSGSVRRPLRGGCFLSPLFNVRSAARLEMSADARVGYFGMRVARGRHSGALHQSVPPTAHR